MFDVVIRLLLFNSILSVQHSVQLQQDYEDTRSEMPWLQLEEESLDQVKPVSTRKPEIKQPAVTVSVMDSYWWRWERADVGME